MAYIKDLTLYGDRYPTTTWTVMSFQIVIQKTYHSIPSYTLVAKLQDKGIMIPHVMDPWDRCLQIHLFQLLHMQADYNVGLIPDGRVYITVSV